MAGNAAGREEVLGVDFGLLGPLVVRDGTRQVPVSAPQQRVLLAALLLSAGRVVSLDDLAETLWEGQPPSGARGRAAQRGSAAALDAGPAGRRPDRDAAAGIPDPVGRRQLDVREFSVLAARGHAAAEAGTWALAADLLREALGWWRGEPLADVPSRLLHDREVPPIEDQRLQALVARIDCDLHLGRHGEVVAELRQLVTAHPLQEQFHAQLMLGLYRNGRQADALAAYQDVRRVLADELGLDPGPELRLCTSASWPPTASSCSRRARRHPARAGDAQPGRPGSRGDPMPPAPRGRRWCPGTCPRRRGISPAGPRRSRTLAALAARRRGEPRDGHRGHRRDGRDRQDHAGPAFRAPGRRAVPGRAAVREPARLRPGRAADDLGRGPPALPGRPGRAGGPDSGRPGRAGGLVPQPPGRPADAGAAG